MTPPESKTLSLVQYLDIQRHYFWVDGVKYLDAMAWSRLIEVLPLLDQIAKNESRRVSNAFLVAYVIGYIAQRCPRPAIACGTAEFAIETWRAELKKDGLTDDGWNAITKVAPPKLQGWARRLKLHSERPAAIAEANSLALAAAIRCP